MLMASLSMASVSMSRRWLEANESSSDDLSAFVTSRTTAPPEVTARKAVLLRAGPSLLRSRRGMCAKLCQLGGTHVPSCRRGKRERIASAECVAPWWAVGCPAAVRLLGYRRSGSPHGCSQEEDLEGQGAQPAGFRVEDPPGWPQRLQSLRRRQAAPSGVRPLRVVSRPAGHRSRIAAHPGDHTRASAECRRAAMEPLSLVNGLNDRAPWGC